MTDPKNTTTGDLIRIMDDGIDPIMSHLEEAERFGAAGLFGAIAGLISAGLTSDHELARLGLTLISAGKKQAEAAIASKPRPETDDSPPEVVLAEASFLAAEAAGLLHAVVGPIVVNITPGHELGRLGGSLVTDLLEAAREDDEPISDTFLEDEDAAEDAAEEEALLGDLKDFDAGEPVRTMERYEDDRVVPGTVCHANLGRTSCPGILSPEPGDESLARAPRSDAHRVLDVIVEYEEVVREALRLAPDPADWMSDQEQVAIIDLCAHAGHQVDWVEERPDQLSREDLDALPDAMSFSDAEATALETLRVFAEAILRAHH